MENKHNALVTALEETITDVCLRCERAAGYPVWGPICTSKTVRGVMANMVAQPDKLRLAALLARGAWERNKLWHLKRESRSVALAIFAEDILPANPDPQPSVDHEQRLFEFLVRECNERPEAAAAFIHLRVRKLPSSVVAHQIERHLGVHATGDSVRQWVVRLYKRQANAMKDWAVDEGVASESSA